MWWEHRSLFLTRLKPWVNYWTNGARSTLAGAPFYLVILVSNTPSHTALNCRVHLTMVNDLVGWKTSFTFMPNDDNWKVRRKLFVQEYHPSTLSRLQPNQLRVTHELLRELLDSPSNTGEECMQHFRTSFELINTYPAHILTHTQMGRV